MKKLLLLPLLFAAMTMFAATNVETFTTKNGATTSNFYMPEATKLECAQTSWTVLGGGIKQNVGNMGSDNYAALFRAKRTDDTFEGYPYIMSDSIENGIDSLWFTWNSNGKETGKTWNVHIYINDEEVGSITEAGAAQIAAGDPFKKFSVGQLKKKGKFVIKLVNEFDPAVAKTSNVMRMVIDDLSWTTYSDAPIQEKPTFDFAEDALIKKIDADAFTNTLTSTSDATPTFESSVPAVATVDADGKVTIVGVGTTVITAKVAATANFMAAEASYTLRVVPLNFNMETFDGAENVDLNTDNTYLTTPTESTNASQATGIKWTTLLGSVRNSLGGSTASNLAAVVRAKKTAEENYGYLLSSKISGGIDSLAFEWNANGTEASRTKNWDIDIFVNDTKVGSINDKGAAVQPMGSWFRFGVGDLKVDGDFTIKIVNNNVPDNGTGNQYRFVVDNIEWYSYKAPAYSVAGSAALLGSEWNEKEGNEMTKQEDGTYKLELKNVALAKGEYEFKVVIDHKWNNGEVAENSKINIAFADDYNVTIVYDPKQKTTTATVERIAVYSVAGAEALFGVNWKQDNEATNMTKQEDGTYKLELKDVELAVANYEYKVVVDHKWENGEVQQNSVLSIDKAGIYDITFTYNPVGPETNAVATLKQEVIILPQVQLAGAFNSWAGEDLTPAENKLTASISKTLTAGDYKFKMIIASGWMGDSQEFTRANNSAVVNTNGQDMTLKADKDGAYLFTWTFETNTLEITFPVGTAIDNAAAQRIATKQIINGQLVITIDGNRYDTQGLQIK
ncbi:MAG: hypothetical protein J5688_00435 [Paludibacteraceae bacterium]|nr:hypothetical protein [Paludibacteraceae bacterium]